MRIGRSGLLAAIPVFAAPVALAASTDGYGYHHEMMGGVHWILGPIMMILFVALIVAAVLVALRLFGFTAGANASSTDRSLAILRERYARSEIDQEEFEARKKRLQD